MNTGQTLDSNRFQLSKNQNPQSIRYNAANFNKFLELGGHFFRQISFVTPVAAVKEIPVNPDVDGVLPTALFRSVFLSYGDHFAVLQP